MLAKDLKKFSLVLPSCLSAFFGAIVNIIPELYVRQICNPLAILFSIGLSTFILHSIKSFSNNRIIKNNILEIDEVRKQISECNDNSLKEKLELEVEKCRNENSRLRKKNSKIEIKAPQSTGPLHYK